jgi:hypothetical protein
MPMTKTLIIYTLFLRASTIRSFFETIVPIREWPYMAIPADKCSYMNISEKINYP